MAGPAREGSLLYFFEDFALDTDRRELRRGADLVALEPQAFDLLELVVRNRDRVVSKDDLVCATVSIAASTLLQKPDPGDEVDALGSVELTMA